MSMLTQSDVKEYGFMDLAILVFLKLTIFLMPLIFLPFTYEAFDFNKQNALWFFTFLTFTLWILKIVIIDRRLVYKRTPLDIPMIILSVVWLLSAILGVDWFSSFFGYYGRFTDAYLSTISFILFYFLIINNVEKKHIIGLLNTFLLSSCLALFAGILSLTGILTKIIGSAGGRLSMLNSLSFNTTAGASEPFALFAASIFILAVALHSYNIRGRKKLLILNSKYYVAGFLSFAVLILVNFALAWVTLSISLAALLMFALYIIYMNRDDEKITVEINLAPILIFFIVSILFLFLFAGTGSLFGVKLFREVVLPIDTAKVIIWNNFKIHPVFGFGPGNFAYAFSLARPATFNQNQFWQLRFDKAPMYIAELISTVGVAGLLAYLAVIGVFFFITFIFLRNIFRTSQEESFVAFGFSFVALSLFVAQLLYLANTVLLFTFWFALTMAMLNWRFAFSKVFINKNVDLKAYKDISPILTTVLILVIFTFLLLTFLQGKYYIADINYNNYRLSGQLDFLQTAVKLAPHRINYNLALARHYINNSMPDIEMLSTVGQGDLSADKKEELQNNIQKSIRATEAAVSAAPNSVMAWELLAAIYRDVRFIAVGSLDPAIKNFQKAVTLEPTNPILLTELARLYLAHNQTSDAVDVFNSAIENKADYIDAHIGLAKTYDVLGQTDKALLILEEINRVHPSAEVIYESGRLYYNQNDFDSAIERFNRAIQLRPDYANAIYSLGLAYQKKGEKELALEQFNKLLESNPDSELIKSAVSSLQSVN